MALDLFEELKQVVRALDEAGVDYAIVGALAVAIHGAPRATGDIDLLIERQSLPKAMEVARSLGFTIATLPLTFRDGGELQRITKLAGREMLMLDYLLVTESLVSIWESRMRLETDFGPLSVISRDALIAMKVSTGHPRDLGDVASLKDLDMSPSAITARIRAVADCVDLRPEVRLSHKLDMTPAGISARLASVESLRRLCAALVEIGRNNGLVR